MKCLIIASDIGISAPGIVYETIIKELSKSMEISLIVVSCRDGINMNVSMLPSAHKGYEHYRIANMFMSSLGRPLFDCFWLERQRRLLNPDIVKCQDVIISFVSFHNYKGVLLGNYLSQKYNKKWIIYSVDAIPAPLGWGKDGRFYRNTRRFISKYISRCDAFFSANAQMLDYQLKPVQPFAKPSGVMFTPIRTDIDVCMSTTSLSPVFLYTGGLYGPRRKEALIDGFRLFLRDYPSARLVFVGINYLQPFASCQDLIDSGNVEVYGYTRELKKFYDEATVLIDINAYFDNDVFLSSKIVNYLPLMKPIISITGLNSPSRNIFTKDPTIIHCRHDAHEVHNGLLEALNAKKSDFSKREYYIRQFSVENVIKSFKDTLFAV